VTNYLKWTDDRHAFDTEQTTVEQPAVQNININNAKT